MRRDVRGTRRVCYEGNLCTRNVPRLRLELETVDPTPWRKVGVEPHS